MLLLRHHPIVLLIRKMVLKLLLLLRVVFLSCLLGLVGTTLVVAVEIFATVFRYDVVNLVDRLLLLLPV